MYLVVLFDVKMMLRIDQLHENIVDYVPELNIVNHYYLYHMVDEYKLMMMLDYDDIQF